MTGLRRSIALLALLSSFSARAWSASADEVSDLYREGVDLLQKGRDEEALERFTRVLAMQPSHEAAYELWKSTEDDILLEMLVKGGQYELVAKRFLDLARLGHEEKRDDADAIRGLLQKVHDEDVMVRKRAIRELSANHGDYAVQHMLPTLADQDAADRRVYYMQALTEMSTDVVLPLVAALDSEDAFLRRNVAIVLGYIRDPRAAAELTWLGNNDPDEGARTAAKEAAVKCGSNGNALQLFLRDGDDFHHRRARVLRPSWYSAVVWSYADGKLVSSPVPRYLYPDELSKNSYYGALKADPSSLDARAGIARAYVSEQAHIQERQKAGLDTGEAANQLAGATIAVQSTGVEALDRALSWSVSSGDVATGIALANVLGGMAGEPTPGLWAAFQEGDGALSREAAVAIGRIAFDNDQGAQPGVVAKLGEAVGTQVLRIVTVIDADEARAQALSDALASHGLVVHAWNSGAKGLNLLRRVPGVDAIVVADMLPDLTLDQVLDEIARDEKTAQVPVIVLSNEAEKAKELYGERSAAVISGAGDVESIVTAMADRLGDDRERANDLASRAATVLDQLARGSGRTDLSPSLNGLVGALVGPPDSEARPDSVAVPAMHALAAAGRPEQVPALLAVLQDADRSDDARVAAAEAVGAIAKRMNMNATEDVLASFKAVLGSDATLAVRSAAAKAVGQVQLTPAQRAEIARSARVNVSE